MILAATFGNWDWLMPQEEVQHGAEPHAPIGLATSRDRITVCRETCSLVKKPFAPWRVPLKQVDQLDLPERLVMVLEAGQKAGGDKRGRQSAALLIYKTEGYPYLSLRVDEHSSPVAELRRVLEVARHQLLPFVGGLPSRDNPLGALSKEVTDILMMPPHLRPGSSSSN